MSSLLRSIQYCVIMKARSLLKRGPNSVIQGPGFGGGRGSGRPGCLGGGGVQGGPGGAGVSGGRAGGWKFWRENSEKPRKNQKNAPELCAGGSSRPNGSGYPLSVPAVAHPPFPLLERERGRLNLQVSNTPFKGWRI